MKIQGKLIISIISMLCILFFPAAATAQSLVINEVLASNLNNIKDEDGDNEDWIEIYNYGATAINLAGFGLSDNAGFPFKWVFPDVSINPGAYLLIWASGKNRVLSTLPLHASFSLNSEGEEVILTSSVGVLVDYLAATPIPSDYSYGRYPSGTNNWFYYTETTPKAPNSQNTTVLPPEPPVFSITSGFFTEGDTLLLSHPDAEATIIYTVDGSEPTVENLSGVNYFYKNQYPQDPGQETGPLLTNNYTSAVYSYPIVISDRSPEPGKLTNISSTWHYSPDYFPTEPVKKATVVRAAAVVNGKSSKIITHTYFVSGTAAFSSSLPVASIALNEDALFDYYDGIYVAGRDFDDWRNKNPNGITNGHVPANYRREGIVTEKPASFQYFVDGEEVINQNIGLRLHGSFSRSPQNKTFRLYARSEYDEQDSFEYRFFGRDNSASFKRLLLRNSGNDVGNRWIGGAYTWTVSPAVYFRDAFIHKMVSHLNFDTQDYMPVITYVNGEYWGLLNLRERYDHHYLERKYGIQEEDIEYLTGNGTAQKGNNTHYLMMRNFVTNNNITLDNNYNYVKTLMDTDNFIDYQIAEIFSQNTDWPANNIDYFRKRTSGYQPEAPYGQDGRWRWLLFDTDHGFGWYGGTSYTHNTLQSASNSASTEKVLLYKLLQNQSFRNDFINRYSDLLNTAFLPARLNNLISEFAGRIAEEIPQHRARWNTLHNWEDHVVLMREFANKRPEYARSHIRSRFNLGSNITALLDVSDSRHGYIRINTIEIRETTPGVSVNPYPWSGIYFRNIPLKITAVPEKGYQFSHWSGASNSNEPSILINPTGNIVLKANFIPIKEDDFDLICFWLLDDRIENNVPLQSIQSTYCINDEPAAITFMSSMGEGYPFKYGDPGWRKGSLERRNAPTPVNYYPLANNNLPFGSFEMRGIQVTQPFLTNGSENALILNFSTENYHNIHVSFAAFDEGAAKRLVIDYFDEGTGRWLATGIAISDDQLATEYKQFNINLSQVSLADNNANLNLRIRFAGTDMTIDDSGRVTFNNISVRGTKDLTNSYNIANDDWSARVLVYPNPTAGQVSVQIHPILKGMSYNLYNLDGYLLQSGILNDQITTLNMEHLPAGIYFLRMGDEILQYFKIVKE